MERTMTALPTLRKTVHRAFLRLVVPFGVLGIVLVIALFFASRIPLLLLRMNYDSIVYARIMEESLEGLRFPVLHPERDAAQWKARFIHALDSAAANITEQAEKEVVPRIRQAWNTFSKDSSGSNYKRLREAIAGLVGVNERGMLQRLEEYLFIRNAIVFGAVAALILAIAWTFFLADNIAMRFSHPLRRAAEVFRERPPLGSGLRLPKPQALEVRILFDELTRLWSRLGELDALNVSRLLAEKRKLEVILESAEDAVLVSDAAGTVAHVSNRMLELLGLPRKAVLGHFWNDLSTCSENYLALRNALRPDMQGTYDIVLDRDGEEQIFTARRRDLCSSGGAVVGQVFLLSDITEKKRRDTLRAEMMDWISHELKTPMQSLGLAAELMARREGLDGEMTMLVDTVRQDAARLRAVARQFMEIARMNPGTLNLTLEEASLSEELSAWLKPFYLVAREAGIMITFDSVQERVPVRIDKERFAWVASNLISNSLRVCSKGDAVQVRLAVENGEARLSVLDNGPGVPPELEPKLFEPFSHGRTAGTKDGLAGLGLAIARTLVEAHGGTIRYTRESGWSAFIVRLPLTS